MSRSGKQAAMYLLVPSLFLLILYGMYAAAGVSAENYVVSQLYMAIEKGSPDYKETSFDTGISFQSQNQNQKQKWIGKSEVQNPAVGERYARVSCEDMELDAFLYFGDTEEILKHGIGQYEKSSLPGFGSTILVCGNNHTYMAPLENIKVKNIITVVTEYGTYQYQVRETQVVKAEDTAACQLDSKTEQLILYTSYPFGEIFAKSEERFFVYCDKISGPEVEEK